MKTAAKTLTIGEEIQSLLDRMDMTRRDLARESKLSLTSVENALSAEGLPSYRTQIAIELALNQPLWSTPDHFARVKEIKELIGFAPQVESFKKLKGFASRLRIKGYGSITSKPDLTAAVVRELAARDKRKKELYAQMDADFHPRKPTAP